MRIRDRYAQIVKAIERCAPAVGPAARLWRSVVYQTIKDALYGDDEAASFCGTARFREMLRLGGLPSDVVYDAMSDAGMECLAGAAA